MIVLVILSILVALSYPSYQSQMRENRRTDGQRILLELMNEQQKYFSENSRYTADLIGDLGKTDAGSGAVASENGYYLVTASVCGVAIPINDCVLLTAAAQGAQQSDGPLTYNSRNVKTPIAHW